MKRFFLVASLLIIAPVYANEPEDFAAFLDRYQVFKKERDAQSNSHTARFSGKLTFKQEAEKPAYRFGKETGAEQNEDCPQGNNYVQCLVSAEATITSDPNDIGGRAYVMVMAGTSVLDQNRRWLPSALRDTYTLVLPQIGRTHTITIPIPDAATVAQACASNDGKPIPLFIGYGAVMSMDLELARRVKLKSAEFGKQYDEDAYAFSRARFNGMRPKKHGQFGEVTCRPVYEG